jgi:hypothetical protein
MPLPADVVAAFNLLGYNETFAAVAKQFDGVSATVLYAQFPSREALGEIWLSECLPKDQLAGGIGAVFSECTFRLLGALNEQRDFSLAWLAALRVSGVRLPKLERLHTSLQDHYAAWLKKRSKAISLPEPLIFADVYIELADTLSLATLGLISAWEADRSPGFGQTGKRVESMAYLLDALLMSRPAFGDKGLLVHMVDLLGMPYDQLLGPLLDLLRKPQRATRLAQLLATPHGRFVRPLLDLVPNPDRATHLVDALLRVLKTAGEKQR